MPLETTARAVLAPCVSALCGLALVVLGGLAQAQSNPSAAPSSPAPASGAASSAPKPPAGGPSRADAGAAGAASDASAPLGIADAGAPPPPSIPDAAADAGASHAAATCAEQVPEGKERPGMRQRISNRGLAGYAVTLVVIVDHGKAEKLFPSGFRLNRTGEEAAEFLKSGFAFPDLDGGAGPELKTEQTTAGATTTVSLHFVALPPKGGRQVLTLPAVPITIARANGDLITLCTQPETITIDPPIANTPNPQPHANPPPRPQREVWESAKIAAATALIALVVGALVASFLIWLRRRPKPLPPPPPPRPPWEVAMEALHDLRQRQLINQERYDEHFDEVCLILRRYLGDRYGIGEQLGDAGALESTTEEILRVLSRIVPPIPVIRETEDFLREADLVKFAKATPGAEQCEAALAAIEQIVTRTVPKRSAGEASDGSPGAAAASSVEVLVSGAASSRTAPASARREPPIKSPSGKAAEPVGASAPAAAAELAAPAQAERDSEQSQADSVKPQADSVKPQADSEPPTSDSDPESGRQE